jgi:hypothetical protein
MERSVRECRCDQGWLPAGSCGLSSNPKIQKFYVSSSFTLLGRELMNLISPPCD